MLDYRVFWVGEGLQCLRAKEIEQGKRTDMLTFFSRTVVFIKCTSLYY